MPIQNLHIGMAVRHPQYGTGVVKALTELTADISFDDARRTIAPGSSELISYRFATGRNRFGAQLEPGTGGVVVITERLLTNNFR